MNLCDLVSYLTDHDEIEEVLLEDEEGNLVEFDMDITEETFDGWDTRISRNHCNKEEDMTDEEKFIIALHEAQERERIAYEELQKMRKRAEKAERELKELRDMYGDNR